MYINNNRTLTVRLSNDKLDGFSHLMSAYNYKRSMTSWKQKLFAKNLYIFSTFLFTIYLSYKIMVLLAIPENGVVNKIWIGWHTFQWTNNGGEVDLLTKN